ncbi:MAG: hypothetical protein LBG74_01770, partial [Spirochaetaceae bacterium]|nr:hypothetical protein [Spirochaetaceae bacterium]
MKKACFAASFLLYAAAVLPAQVISLWGGFDYSFYDKSQDIISPAPAPVIIFGAVFEGYFAGVFKYNFSFMNDAVVDYLFNMDIALNMKYVT